ncbi:Tyrosine-protein kinase [Caenorhabditis elegans]|uniref:Tyrosine-protein kinase n=1 Tax=Caenorhabditis elegans TaxID=6239 RepID=Q9XXE5_CAEEL|nr:Tyrosine-protein kinase [Caenorhabditis elegans]CAA19511.1 Tyrosine-protein kinase [Caenorhabditis elegans]|eukprot:NP_501907.1 Tyrosine-protein kinase [Caenorhabditis elegans]
MASGTASMQRPSIEKEPYYHGFLPREDVKTVLKNNGDFVIRISEPQAGSPRSNILSVMHCVPPMEEEIKHYVIKTKGDKIFIEKVSFLSIPEMVEWHLTKKESVQKDVFLIKAISRQAWELDHDNIEPLKKLGEGAFGEVMMGTMKFRKGGKSVQVAIKQAKLSNLTKEQIKEFMGEARVMRSLSHPHVVRFYGVPRRRVNVALCRSLNEFLAKCHRKLRCATPFFVCMSVNWLSVLNELRVFLE